MRTLSLRSLRHQFPTFLAALACVIGFSAQVDAQQIIHVPSEQPTLQAAINSISDGGIIEIANGTYNASGGAFNIFGGTKGFTIRAAAGSTVVLTGNGSTDILRFTDSTHQVTFQGITFSNGVSNTNGIGGALTLVNVRAVFENCSFENNAANGPTGGGAQWIDASSIVAFKSCTWTNNTSPRFGGAMSVGRHARVYLRDCRFLTNRVNVSGASKIPNSDGGAIHLSNSLMRIDNCAFDANEAGYTGGAISALGDWDDAETTELIINNSEFTENSANQPRTPSFNVPTIGGALHTEAKTNAKISNCRFTNNTAQQGGAVSMYQSVTDVLNTVFKNNRALGNGADEGQGGTFVILSADNPGSAVNRRSSQVSIRDSLFQGSGRGTPSARQGGSIFANGDLNFAYGLGGLPQNGTPESNRAVVRITRCAFVDTAVSGGGGVAGNGGAIEGAFVDLIMANSIIENCDAGNSGSGGGLILITNSVGTIGDTTFSRCSAGFTGSAITAFGGTLNLLRCNLINNQADNSSFGSTITTGHAAAGFIPAFDMLGVMQDCVLSDNTGPLVIYDSDLKSDGAGGPPFNRFQYSGNSVWLNGTNFFFSDVAGEQTVSQLNGLVIPRNDGSTTDKSPVDNIALSSAPSVGAILLLPPTVLNQGAPGETLPISSYVAFAADGGQVAIDTAVQTQNGGILQTPQDVQHVLTVGSASFSTVPPPQAALNISTRLPVGTDQNVLIGGIIIAPPGGASKRVLVRAIGPSLNVGGVPVPGTLQDPVLELHDHTGATIANNDNWRSSLLGGAVSSDQAIEIQGTGAAPTSDAEAAIVATLNPFPETYTAVVRGANNTTGIALVELYDLDAVQDSSLANISTRGFIQTGDNVMIGGFILLGGTGQTKVIVRGIGPSLAKSGVSGVLADPVLELHDANGGTVETNDDWEQSLQKAELQAVNLAPSDPAESAIFRNDLPRGAYTAILRGSNGGTGIGLVEAYVFQ
jgi:hypothetical protein